MEFQSLLTNDTGKAQYEIYQKFKNMLEKSSIDETVYSISILERNFRKVPEETAETVLTVLVSIYYKKVSRKKEKLRSVSECIWLLRRANRIMIDLTNMGDTIEGKSYLKMFSFLLFYSIIAINDIIDKANEIQKKNVQEEAEELSMKFKEMAQRRRRRRRRKHSVQKSEKTKVVEKLERRLSKLEKEIDSLLSSDADGEAFEASLYSLERRQSMIQKKRDLMLLRTSQSHKNSSQSREEKTFGMYKKISFHSDGPFKRFIKALLDPINKAFDVIRKVDGDRTADTTLHTTIRSMNMACHIFGGL